MSRSLVRMQERIRELEGDESVGKGQLLAAVLAIRPCVRTAAGRRIRGLIGTASSSAWSCAGQSVTARRRVSGAGVTDTSSDGGAR